jgi:hypothetical protein
MCHPVAQSIYPIVPVSRFGLAEDLDGFRVTGHVLCQYEQHPIPRQSNALIIGNLQSIFMLSGFTLRNRNQRNAPQVIVQRVGCSAVSDKTGSVYIDIGRDRDRVASVVCFLLFDALVNGLDQWPRGGVYAVGIKVIRVVDLGIEMIRLLEVWVFA